MAGHPSSFRDPDGFVFPRGGTVFRQVNQSGRESFDRLIASGLYEELAGSGRLIRHEEVGEPPEDPATGWKVIRPEPVPFVSYPYEWCFGQLRQAALLTLSIQKAAMERGLSLKDASAFNVQFLRGRPVFIDTLSFEPHVPGRPWIAYRQFCQHFLAPLLLMRHGHPAHGLLSRVHLDGIPLDLASAMLPLRTRLSFSTLVHIHLHAWAQTRKAAAPAATTKAGTSTAAAAGAAKAATAGTAAETGSAGPAKRAGDHALRGLIDSLEGAVRGLEPPGMRSVWAGYYAETNYSERAFASKRDLVGRLLDKAAPDRTAPAKAAPRTVWDLGANTGVFSRLAAERGMAVVAFDLDPVAVELNHRETVRKEGTDILPLVMDLANPSPGLGWNHAERLSLKDRGPADAVLALALVHHLAIGNNLPFDRIAAFLADLGPFLILEFAPREDSQVRRMLASRRSDSPGYTREAFEAAFLARFRLVERADVEDSLRTLYLFEKRTGRP